MNKIKIVFLIILMYICYYTSLLFIAWLCAKFAFFRVFFLILRDVIILWIAPGLIRVLIEANLGVIWKIGDIFPRWAYLLQHITSLYMGFCVPIFLITLKGMINHISYINITLLNYPN